MPTPANAALDRLEADEAFARQVSDAGSPEASLRVIQSAGFEVTAQDMRDAAIDRFGEQMTTQQLDALAAGKLEPLEIAGISAGAGVVVGAAIFAAAAAI